MKKRVFVIALALLAALPLYPGGVVQNDAAIKPGSTLPAVPFWVSFTFRNAGTEPLSMPPRYGLEVVDPHGHSFLAVGPTGPVLLVPEVYSGDGPLAPGEARLIEFPIVTHLGDGFLLDRRVRQPGLYQLRVILFPEGSRDFHESWRAFRNGARIAPSPIVTPPMSLTLEEPSGVDATAWKELLDRNSGSAILTAPGGAALAFELWQKYPDSRYAPYFAFDAAEQIVQEPAIDKDAARRDWEDAVVRIDRDGIYDALFNYGRAVERRLELGRQRDFQSALRLRAEIQARLEAVVKTAPHEYTRAQARAALRKLDSVDELKSRYGVTPAVE